MSYVLTDVKTDLMKWGRRLFEGEEERTASYHRLMSSGKTLTSSPSG